MNLYEKIKAELSKKFVRCDEMARILALAIPKRQIEAGADFKVVLMSATLEADKLAAFFNGAPVIEVPGRLFPVEVKTPSMRLIDDVAALVSAGRNVLVFQPGKQEITETCAALERMEVNAEILPLHGELSPEEQAKCFRHYGRPKVVVSTNVAQTSVTIDDIDAVVDSGMERRIELVEGVEGLYLKPISLADSKQRKGRAGRTKPGIYIDHCGASNRPDFSVAEIMRKRLDQTVLRLAIAGFDMEELEFFHQPEKSEIHDARQTLIGLGCMKADGSVTKIGKFVNRLPVSVQYARMLVEAERLGVVDDVLTVAAIMEMGGITVPPPSPRVQS
jgi:HrpA-like RNA helicase